MAQGFDDLFGLMFRDQILDFIRLRLGRAGSSRVLLAVCIVGVEEFLG